MKHQLESTPSRGDRILDSIEEGFVSIDPEWRYTYINRAAGKMIGRDRGELIGKAVWKEFPNTCGTALEEALRSAMADRRIQEQESFCGDRWFYNKIYPDADGGLSVIFQDVTRTKTLLEQMRRSEARLRLVADHTPAFISYVNKDGFFEFANAMYAEWFGLEIHEIIGRHVRDVLGSGDFEKRKPYLQRALRGEAIVFQGEVRHKRLGLRDVQLTYVPDQDNGGRVEGLYVFGYDITDRIRLEEERSGLLARERAAHEEAKLRREHLYSLFMQAPAGISILRGPDHIVELINPRVRQAVGRDVTGMGIREALPEYKDQGYFELFDKVYQTGVPYFGKEIPNRILQPDGTWRSRYLNFVLQPWRDVDGKIAGIMTISVDVTEEVMAKQRLESLLKQLRTSEEHFRELADSMPQIVWAARPDGYTDYFNKRWYELTGFPEGQGGDESWTPSLHPDDVQKCLEGWYQAVRSGTTYEMEYRFKDKESGSYRWYLARALPIRNKEGQVTRWFGTSTDIDDLKRAQEQVLEEKKKLEQINRELDNFSHIVSHDLRSPVRSIFSFAELLEAKHGKELDEAASEYLQQIKKGAQTLNDLIEGLLSLSKLSRIQNPYEEVDMGGLVRSVLDRMALDLGESGCEVRVLPGLPRVYSDPIKIAEVFANLLSNALKFSLKGGSPAIEIGFSQSELEQVFWVKDNGIGIDPKYHKEIFNLFRRLHTPEEFEGTGMGLHIVKKIVEEHGGRVGVESRPGEGSTFCFTLPRRKKV